MNWIFVILLYIIYTAVLWYGIYLFFTNQPLTGLGVVVAAFSLRWGIHHFKKDL